MSFFRFIFRLHREVVVLRREAFRRLVVDRQHQGSPVERLDSRGTNQAFSRQGKKKLSWLIFLQLLLSQQIRQLLH